MVDTHMEQDTKVESSAPGTVAAPSQKAKSGDVLMNIPDLHNKTVILVVDDEKLIRLTVSAKLKKAGYIPVAVGAVDEAVQILKEHISLFSAIISDIMMGSMDGFDFRDIVRGMDRSMPFFFMTALDPEEGSGFLKRIVTDPLSYYLPKAVGTEVLLKRVQQIVASRRVERFIEKQVEETKQSLKLASHIQSSMLPVRACMNDRFFYAAWWQPKEVVSGDIYEVIPFGSDAQLYIVGDIQGHGTSAALAMTAVQSFLKNLVHRAGESRFGPVEIANLLQGFFRENLADVSYMTALICLHNFGANEVQWISCGAPDLIVSDRTQTKPIATDPSRKGGLPVGLFADTVYTKDDLVVDKLSPESVCVVVTDGIYDLSRDEEGFEKIPRDLLHRLRCDLVQDARANGSLSIEANKYIVACQEYGYGNLQDDVTILTFGPRIFLPGIFEATVPLSPSAVDEAAQKMGGWCRAAGWDENDISRVQLVLEEKVMNVYDHGFDDVDRLREVVCIRLLTRREGEAELTVWDCGTPEPSLAVAAGTASTAFELINRDMSNHGRGRLMVRELCKGVERKRYGALNETVYHVRIGLEENTENA